MVRQKSDEDFWPERPKGVAGPLPPVFRRSYLPTIPTLERDLQT